MHMCVQNRNFAQSQSHTMSHLNAVPDLLGHFVQALVRLADVALGADIRHADALEVAVGRV